MISQFLSEQAPQTLLHIGGPIPELAKVCESLNITFSQSTSFCPTKLAAERYELSVVSQSPEHKPTDAKELMQLLGALKNLHSDKILFLERGDALLSYQQILALGFSQDTHWQQLSDRAFSYNIENYNKKRDWNSPKNWANPERWHIRF